MRVAPEREPTTPVHQFRVPAGATIALPQPQVGCRARGDCRTRLKDGVDLRVIQPYRVSQQQSRTQDPEIAQVQHRPAAGPPLVRGHIAWAGRQVPGNACAEPLSERGRASEQLVTGQIMPDQRDPPTHPAIRTQRADHLLLRRQGLCRRHRIRLARRVPAPAADPAPDTRGTEPGRDAQRVRDGTCVKQCGHAAGERLGRCQGGGQLIVITGHRRVQRHDPSGD